MILSYVLVLYNMISSLYNAFGEAQYSLKVVVLNTQGVFTGLRQEKGKLRISHLSCC